MRIHADGTALTRYLRPACPPAEAAAWAAWVLQPGLTLVTTSVAIGQMRVAAAALDHESRMIAADVAASVTIVAHSDQSMKVAAMAAAVMPAFSAMQLASAVADPECEHLATYDSLLAQVAVIHGLRVISPGRPERWWVG